VRGKRNFSVVSKQSLDDFKQHLIAVGKSKDTAALYAQRVARFLLHVAEPRIERIGEDLARSYLAGIKDRRIKHGYATAVSQFLKFAAAHAPMPVITGADKASQKSVQTEQETPPDRQWSFEKLIDEKSRTDELIAELGRKLMDHYLYFQARIQGEGENPEHLYRLANEARQLIESNLTVFIGLSSGGPKDSSRNDFDEASSMRQATRRCVQIEILTPQQKANVQTRNSTN
jgi:hypothetical protein